MLRRCLWHRCDRLMNTVLLRVPHNDVVTLADLSTALPDDVLETVSDEYGGLKEFIRNFPQHLTFHKVEAKGKMVQCVSRAGYDGVMLKMKEGPGPQRTFMPAAELPVDIVKSIKEKLGTVPHMGVSALYGSLKGSDRREIRMHGGILAVLRHYSHDFLLSPLGILAATNKGENNVMLVDDDPFGDGRTKGGLVPAMLGGDGKLVPRATVSETFTDVAPTPEGVSINMTPQQVALYATSAEAAQAAVRKKGLVGSLYVTPEALHYHAMFFVRYMPLHWTIKDDMPKNIPAEIQTKHCIMKFHEMLPLLSDFLEAKNGIGCKHTIMRLKRGVNIPDVGVIRSDEEMESLQLAQGVYAFMLDAAYEEPIPYKKLEAVLRGDSNYIEVMKKLKERFQSTLQQNLTSVATLTDSEVSTVIPRELNRAPLSFQVLKATVPKHYVKLTTIQARLTKTATKEAEAYGGLLAWLRANKETYEVTIPYVRNARPFPPSVSQEQRLCVRRRHTSYILTNEDRVLDVCRELLPKDKSRWTLRELLAMLPPDIVDVLPLDVVPYLLQISYPCIYVDRSPTGRFYVRRGLARDDGTSGKPTIGFYDPNNPTDDPPPSEPVAALESGAAAETTIETPVAATEGVPVVTAGVEEIVPVDPPQETLPASSENHDFPPPVEGPAVASPPKKADATPSAPADDFDDFPPPKILEGIPKREPEKRESTPPPLPSAMMPPSARPGKVQDAKELEAKSELFMLISQRPYLGSTILGPPRYTSVQGVDGFFTATCHLGDGSEHKGEPRARIRDSEKSASLLALTHLRTLLSMADAAGGVAPSTSTGGSPTSANQYVPNLSSRFLGVCMNWLEDKNHGFIKDHTPEHQGDTYYVHQSEILTPGKRRLFKGEEVEFYIVILNDRYRATQVTAPGGYPPKLSTGSSSESAAGGLAMAAQEPPALPQRVLGVVRSWNKERAFGFAKVPDSKADVFLHMSDVSKSGIAGKGYDKDHLEIGQELEFIIVQVNGKPRATEISKPGKYGQPVPPPKNLQSNLLTDALGIGAAASSPAVKPATSVDDEDAIPRGPDGLAPTIPGFAPEEDNELITGL